ncbi:hypothetical protein [Priestia megaterium]|uniref:hypothetical protein n=1 Tax=Priestia megaterium TaxID=1404 RepID=UPI00263A4039|nr:hypothetical protein [Priestia megaterium]MDN4865567.1 hypothetical protein [Priestia megaterium]
MVIMTVLSVAKVPQLSFLLIVAFLSLSLGGSLLIGESVQASSLKLQALSTGGPIGTLSLVIFHKVIGQAVTHFRLLHVWMLIGLGVLIIYVYQYSLSLFHGH